MLRTGKLSLFGVTYSHPTTVTIAPARAISIHWPLRIGDTHTHQQRSPAREQQLARLEPAAAGSYMVRAVGAVLTAKAEDKG